LTYSLILPSALIFINETDARFSRVVITLEWVEGSFVRLTLPIVQKAVVFFIRLQIYFLPSLGSARFEFE
jgi:hypothetical protein